MEEFFQWSLELIATLQQIHPALHVVFRGITFLGQPHFYVLLLPVLVWCVDVGLGARLGVFLLLSSHLNAALKSLFRQPRPCDFDPNLQLAWFEGYGLPSGHAQFVVVVWGTIAVWVRKCWFWGVVIVLMVLMGLSRIYLGVHFPTDVLAGWMVGALSLVVYVVVQPKLEAWLVDLRMGQQLFLALAVPTVLLITHPTKSNAMAMGTLAGAGAGLPLLHRYVAFSARGLWWQRILRLLAGGAILVLVYVGFEMVLPGEESSLYVGSQFLLFGLVGLWTTLGAPWLFRVLRLAPGAEKSRV